MKLTQLGLRFFDKVRRTRICHFRTPLLTCCCTAGVAVGCCSYGGIRLNSTGSLPLGLYRVTNVANASLAEFCPPEPFSRMSVERGYRPSGTCVDGDAPLLKPIVAKPGDVVVTSERGIAVNGRLLPNTAARNQDSKGRPLPHYPFGTYAVELGTVWVASSYHPLSFDSRYFGPISASSIREHLKPLLVL